MAIPNSKLKALLGPKATTFVQYALPFSVGPDHENPVVREGLLQAMQNLTLNDSAEDQDAPNTPELIDTEMTDAPDLTENSGDVSQNADELARMMGRMAISGPVPAVPKYK